MELSLNPTFFCPDSTEYGYKPLFDMLKRITKNGFTQFDFLPDVKREDYIDHAERCREFFDRIGAKAHQGHCPMWRYKRDIDESIILETSLKAAKSAGIMGSEYLVVHADEYRFKPGEEYDSKKILPLMYEYISKISEEAEKHNVKVCVENLFEEHRYPEMERSRFTSTTEELLGLVEKFGGDVGICWDFGHALCAFGKNTNEAFMQALPYIRCTHVHDNDTKSDWHALPLSGNNDWETQIKALKASGYKGNFSYELHRGKIPDAFIDDYIQYLKKLGDFLISY